MADILVVNPNSSKAVTRSMTECLAPVIASTAHRIRCIEISDAPEGIETDDHVRTVAPLVLKTVSEREADAYVVACFSDPGLGPAKAATDRPVVGIAESAYIAALGLGARFGIISLGESSIARHRIYLEQLRLDGRMANDRSIGMGVVEIVRENAIDRVVDVGRKLRDEDGAEVVILGCAGLGGYRAELQALLQLPVVDPVQAGTAAACTALDLGYRSHLAS